MLLQPTKSLIPSAAVASILIISIHNWAHAGVSGHLITHVSTNNSFGTQLLEGVELVVW